MTVNRMCKGVNVRRKVTKDEIQEWQKLYESGLNTIQIGVKVGRHHSVVYNYLKSTIGVRSKSDVKQGKANPMWVGDRVSFTALHAWVLRHKPKPGLCEKCHLNQPRDLANISQNYYRDVNDFEWLCRKCHMLSDGRMNNLKQFRVV